MNSYFHAPKTFKIENEDIPTKLKKLARKKPDKIAMVMYHSKEERHEITRKELYDRVIQFAQALLKFDLKKKARVALCVSNSINWLAYDVGIMKAGCVPLHLRYGSCDIKTALAGCSVVILEAKKDWDDLLSIAQIGEGGKITCEEYPSLELAIAVNDKDRPANTLLATELMAEIDIEDVNNHLEYPVFYAEDTAFIEVSGTQQLVRHTHIGAVNWPSYVVQDPDPPEPEEDFFIDSDDEKEEVLDDDVKYSSGPLSDTSEYPFDYIQRGVVHVSGDPSFLNDPENLETVVDILKKEDCSIIGMAPQDLGRLKDFGFRVPIITTVDDSLTQELIRNSFLLCHTLIVIYNIVEGVPLSQKVFTEENVEEFDPIEFGQAREGLELKIVNDRVEVIKFGEAGFLCARGAWLPKNPGKHVTTVAHGWMKTNLVARMKKSGEMLLMKPKEVPS